VLVETEHHKAHPLRELLGQILFSLLLHLLAVVVELRIAQRPVFVTEQMAVLVAVLL
jgi:hypothetical protein